MDNQEMRRRKAVYNLTQLVSLGLGVVAIAIGAYGFVQARSTTLSGELVLAASIAFVIVGMLHNWFYFRTLNFSDMKEFRSYAWPTLVLLLLVAATLLVMFTFNRLNLGYQLSPSIQFLSSAVVTFFLGLIGFSVPLVLQRNALDMTDQSKSYDKILFSLDSDLSSLGAEIFVFGPRKANQAQAIDELTVQLERIEKILALMAGVSYRAVIQQQRRPVDFFKYVSPVIGPVISGIISILLQ